MNILEKHNEPIELIRFIQSSMDKIGRSFFKVVTCGGMQPIARERVYCYELYHQMRCIQNQYPTLSNYILHAEIDKSGHPLIEKKINPDMVIHFPGTMDNLAVIEIKSVKRIDCIIKDFKTLNYMLDSPEYKYGVFISTGFSLKELPDSNINKIYDSIPHLNKFDDKIYIFSQKKYREQIECYKLCDIVKSTD